MDGAGILFVVFSVVALVGLVLIILSISYFQAKKAYYARLEELKNYPHSPNLREQAVRLGRKFARAAAFLHSRGWPVILLNEAAIANDVNAACARAGSEVTIKSDDRRISVEHRLGKLEDLKARGIITEQEYKSRRQQILDEL
jgi:hypothetical protein